MNELRPAIYIYTNNINNKFLKEILAGIEEEGVLYHIVEILCNFTEGFSYNNSKDLAYDAAQNSTLGVGIGIIETTAILQLEKLPLENPLFEINFESDFKTNAKSNSELELRTLGTNAARAVKRQAFKL